MEKRRAQAKGFTLIEILVVVAIVGVAMAIAGTSAWRIRNRSTVESAFARIRAEIVRAQSLSAEAGSRINTPRLVLDPTCIVGGNQLWITFNAAGANTVTIPTTLIDNPATDIMTVQCTTYNFAAETDRDGTAAVVGSGQWGPAPIVNGQFAFAANGRVVLPGGGTGTVFVQASTVNDVNARWGIRILPSGLVCRANENNPATPCDEDA